MANIFHSFEYLISQPIKLLIIQKYNSNITANYRNLLQQFSKLLKNTLKEFV